jgi:uncharacterized protein DUF3800
VSYWTSFPPIVQERNFVAHLFAYFDESGKYKDHPVITFSGFVAGFQQWQNFQDKWNGLLREYKIDAVHTSKAIRYSRPYGNMKACRTAEDRAKDILPFIREIREGIELGIYFAVDVKETLNKHRF